MARRLKFSPQAEADIASIGQYTLDEWGERQRRAYLARVFATLQRIARMPGIGTRRGRNMVYPVGRHVIVYRPAEDLLILRVLHQRQRR